MAVQRDGVAAWADGLKAGQDSYYTVLAVQGQAGFSRLWQYNATEWPHGLMGCAGSFGLGFMMPGMAYCMAAIISTLYNPDPAAMQREVRPSAC